MILEKPQLFTDILAEHGEGPLWDPDRQLLYWVDIMQGRFYRSDLDQKATQTFLVGKPLGVLCVRQEGGLILAVERAFSFFDPAVEKEECLTPGLPEIDERVRMNDGAVDPAGRFLAGTMDYEESRPIGKLYCLDLDGSVKVLEDGLCITNGMSWSTDNRYFYLIDTPTHTIFRYDYDIESGNISNRISFKVFEDNEFPDGMTMDAEGGFWVALWGQSRVVHLDDQGKEMESIHLPAPHVTSCCFGGPDMDQLFITTSRIALDKAQKQKYPLAGRTFVVRTQYKGRKEPYYMG